MANNLTHFDPFRDLTRSDPFRSMESLMKNFGLRSFFGDMEPEPRIRIDVTENEQEYTVKADIPGVRKEDIEVDINNNVVNISAELNQESEKKTGENTVRSERYYGRQYRSFTLAHDIDETQAKASYENGVLQLVLPKKAGGTNRKIAIH
ncbi:Hsp20/alpha crystallin family protein [Noviherbaspirillum galbum]|uniref:Hsp20/alpha crystallin family protein n=1 Tax=Noviherbaspirillum galbum TaxID=2709383 RepID=A0A6B3SNL8_9BURK|nr:Hsp20/alpha crystallin family protein [Noviherbaspirillum galbum]NEX62343.1 Hsp20/alpha crystallin family protein [Noviherbaspirillum galbum]